MDKHFSGVTLPTELGGEINVPTLAEVMTAIDDLTPDGGPSFLILDGLGDAYLQAAGGDGAYVVERRVSAGSAFRHFIAGRHAMPDAEWVSIPTRRASVKVRSNEELRLSEVKALAQAYLDGGTLAAGFVWREKATISTIRSSIKT